MCSGLPLCSEVSVVHRAMFPFLAELLVRMARLFESLGKLGLALAIGGGVVNSALYNGENAEKFLYAYLEPLCCWFLL